MLQSLLPVKLKKEDASYQTVTELAEVLKSALKNKDIRNIALTGPYGSGKSSIIQTLMENYSGFHYLPISLATLQADEEGEEKSGTSGNDEEKDKRLESLNRKIEYSILQQLIYREKAETVPNSRFRRIVHIEKKRLIRYAIECICFILAFIVVFEPSYAKVDTLYDLFNLGKYNVVFDLLGSLYLLFGIFELCRYFIKSYANSKLNKLNLKDGDIEIKEENSIFNKHLDEILYFFQVTDYDVVVIEDLDRFETEKIYLKLRELNQLVNESKIVGRHIVFLYAIKDDVFEDEARTKFFDYITTVIPVINPSNSKAKLKQALVERGYEENEIPDEDLSEIAFFIQDMRILTNIANEYSQYRNKLYDVSKNNLSRTKLLAMIVYKNYFPRDFSQLHRREGKVYTCINSKPRFVEDALKVLDDKKRELEETRKLFEANNHLKENDLRLLYLYEVASLLTPSIINIQIDNSSYTLKQISENATLFNKLLSLESITYTYSVYYNRTSSDTKSVNFAQIAKKIQFEERMQLITENIRIINKKESDILNERLKIYGLKLKSLIKKYSLGNTELYNNLHLEPLMDVFIRQGYIDEDYYDYISYFYPGMVSMADRDLLLSIKRDIKKDYTYHIDKIENFTKELKDYMFDSDSILNNELLDYIARRKGNTMFAQMMKRLERDDAPLDFLAQYYHLGKRQKEVFTDFINWNEAFSWQMISNHTNEDEQQTLREAWLKYCEKTTPEQEKWLDYNYAFLSERVGIIGEEQCKILVNKSIFHKLNNKSEALLDYVIEQCRYEINVDNLCLIINYLSKESIVTSENLNLTRIIETNHEVFEEYIKDSFSETFECFSTTCKDESSDSIIYVLNSENVASEDKLSYLTGQHEKLLDYNGINETVWEIAIKSFVIKPTWENIDEYYRKKESLTDDLLKYVEHYHKELEEECSDGIVSKQSLFEALLCSNELTTVSFRSICKAFDLQFDNNKSLIQVDKERLMILLVDDKIVFSSENTSILKDSAIYSEYLIYYSEDFINTLDKSYQLDGKTAISLLNSNKFTIHEKRQIIDAIDEAIILNSSILADRTIDVLLDSNNISMEESFLKGLLQTAKNLRNRILLINRMLKTSQYSVDGISSLLRILGGKYIEVADRRKRPVLDNNEENISLLTQLRDLHFISSISQEDDGIRVIPPRGN